MKLSRTMVCILAGMVAIPALAGCKEKATTGPEKTESRSFDFSGSSLKIVASEAAVQIKAGGDSGIEVKRAVRGDVDDGGYSFSDGTLRLKATCSGVVKDCSAKYTVTIPKGAAVDLEGSGSAVKISGLRNGLTASLRADASLSVDDSYGAMELRSDGGDITLSHARADKVHATASNDGNVKLSFAEPPQSVEARSYGGAVTVIVPSGSATYRVTISGDTGGGDQLKSDPNSSRTISAIANDGPVVVRKA